MPNAEGLDLYFIYQKKKKGETARSVAEEIVSLADDKSNIKSTLIHHSIVYHHNYTSKYKKRETNSGRGKTQKDKDGPST